MDAYCVVHTTSTAAPSAARTIASTSSAPVAPAPAVPSSAPPLPVAHPTTLLPASSVYASSYPAPYHYPPHLPPPSFIPPYVPGPAQYPPMPHSTPLPHPATPASTVSASPANVSAIFSEYQSLDEPRYYDLPPTTITKLPPSPPTHEVAALTFTNPASSDPRLILRVMLVSGKRILHARALIDPGSTGDFLNSRFVSAHNLSLDARAVPLTCTSFDGSPGLGGLITQFWTGRLSMVASDKQLFDSSVVLDVTTLGDYDLILGMPWLKAHSGWVGAAGPSLLLVNPVSSSTPSGLSPFVSSSSSLAVDSSVPVSVFDTSPSSTLPPQFSHFSDVFFATLSFFSTSSSRGL